MKVVEYENCANIVVEFQDEHKYRTPATYNNFKRGTLKNPYDRALYGVGYLGEGKYTCHENGVLTNHYVAWASILCRCYYEKNRHLNSSYEGCGTIKEWHNLQYFSEWYYDNIYDVGNGERMHVDKDILFNGNKLYSPDTCIIVPQKINILFHTKEKKRDPDLPNAIHRCKTGYQSFYNGKSLGVFNSVESAVKAHDDTMRIHIKQLVDGYGTKLPDKVRNVLLNW
jgi:hypothetical protein